MSNKDFKTPEERRKALKKILTGTGAVTIAASAPGKWTKPVVDSVILPTHAQTSAPLVFGANDIMQAHNEFLDSLVPSAYAGTAQSQLWSLCIEFTNTNRTTYNAGVWDNNPTDGPIFTVSGGAVGVTESFDCVENTSGPTILVTDPSADDVHYYITTTSEGPILEGDATPMNCSLPDCEE